MKRKKIIRLTERDLTRIIQRVVSEQQTTKQSPIGKIATTTPNKKTVNPTIEIDCTKKVIINSQLPKLDKNVNLTIINHYCNK